jgi:hypothetical protein
VLLDPARHERVEFASGEPSLDAWLQRYGGQSRRRDTAATWVIADAVDRVVALPTSRRRWVPRRRLHPASRSGLPHLDGELGAG